MRVFELPEVAERLREDWARRRLRLAEKLADVVNPMDISRFMDPVTGQFFKLRVGRQRVVAITARAPEGGWDLVLVDVFERHTGEVTGGAYHRFLKDEGYREQLLARARSRRDEYLLVEAPGDERPPRDLPPLPTSAQLWLHPTRPPARAQLVVLLSGSIARRPAALVRSAVEDLGRMDMAEGECRRVEREDLMAVCLPATRFNAVRAALLATEEGEDQEPGAARVAEAVAEGSNTDVLVKRLERAADRVWVDLAGQGPGTNDIWTEASTLRLGRPLDLVEDQRRVLDEVIGDGGPIFVTGRAGSSKSTLLYHQFARWCHDASRDNRTGEPRFVTRSVPLLALSRERIHDVLRHDFHLHEEEPLLERMDDWLTTLDDHLRAQLPATQRRRFHPAKQVTADRFRALHEGRSLDIAGQRIRGLADHRVRERIDWEVSWFVIEGIVKGHEPATAQDWARDDFSLEDYESMPSQDRVVAATDVEDVLSAVLPWYRDTLLDNRLWDEQDLALAVLAEPVMTSGVEALACDEAQDFTRVQLLALLRTCSHFGHDLPLWSHSLPVLLAGDELQSLRPTGFRWANVTSAVHILTDAAFAGSRTTRIVSEQLGMNFRSDPGVVALANAIQRARKDALGETHADSQLAHREGHHRPIKGWTVRTSDAGSLTTGLRGNVLIVPCAQGGERDWVMRDPTLSAAFDALIPDWRDQDLPLPVYGPYEVKGLEFDSVVLYGWGAETPRPSECAPEARSNLADRTRWAHLYVAATRATDDLAIVESGSGDAFWHEFGEAVDMRVGGEGLETIARDEAVEARRVAAQGRAKHLPAEMRRAALLFRTLGMEEEAQRCLADALVFEGSPGEGADAWEAIGDMERAAELHWEAAQLPGVVRTTARGDRRHRICRGLAGSEPPLDKLAELLRSEHGARPIPAAVLQVLYDRIAEWLDEGGDPRTALTLLLDLSVPPENLPESALARLVVGVVDVSASLVSEPLEELMARHPAQAGSLVEASCSVLADRSAEEGLLLLQALETHHGHLVERAEIAILRNREKLDDIGLGLFSTRARRTREALDSLL